ncbi:DnaJ homolog subfamily B member 9 [Seminavis robusta]|uniref:DnaJ homolog subfamily B member 9 n=1 Tax=Seminavis robusta TaxID=568900 RepID=A0A9N8DKM1_9STRA|nr:DnaJ homolog subfamily B member 9 [Seminavis robusta]|eukprot:Sro194_g082940.1 DnaJ homolog subfamily B member 9 (159) ;mRNA; f:67264-67740
MMMAQQLDALGRGTHNNTLYDILEVPPTATFDAIKKSYQSLARKLHPDKRNDDRDDAAFLKLQKAWECLRDPISRKDYDAELFRAQSQKSKSQKVEKDEWELVEEEESGELSHVYTCRCGEEIWLAEDSFQKKDNQSTVDSIIYATCPGCSLVYHVVL